MATEPYRSNSPVPPIPPDPVPSKLKISMTPKAKAIRNGAISGMIGLLSMVGAGAGCDNIPADHHVGLGVTLFLAAMIWVLFWLGTAVNFFFKASELR